MFGAAAANGLALQSWLRDAQSTLSARAAGRAELPSE
jgi:hypothetical protein